ncbi:GNAT family N-acetyltransferase [Oricola nitratireducens]|uniref:GNAT family N-acetyltransferase n=1 Tax=Oricola nitratireducens TaxID=2775868 RepID=UPI001AEDC1E5|nr:N-acetyltransferase [Oricola nitratireducens]
MPRPARMPPRHPENLARDRAVRDKNGRSPAERPRASKEAGCRDTVQRKRSNGILDSFQGAGKGDRRPVHGDLLGTTAERDLFVFTAEEAGTIVGGIVFSRLTYDRDDRTVFVLAPVGVATGHQGKGIGQRLLADGLAALRETGIDIAVTYGDPGYYSKVGFAPITEAFAQAPFKLKHPEGWLGQSLTDREMTPLKGPSRCVEALNDPAFW